MTFQSVNGYSKALLGPLAFIGQNIENADYLSFVCCPSRYAPRSKPQLPTSRLSSHFGTWIWHLASGSESNHENALLRGSTVMLSQPCFVLALRPGFPRSPGLSFPGKEVLPPPRLPALAGLWRCPYEDFHSFWLLPRQPVTTATDPGDLSCLIHPSALAPPSNMTATSKGTHSPLPHFCDSLSLQHFSVDTVFHTMQLSHEVRCRDYSNKWD